MKLGIVKGRKLTRKSIINDFYFHKWSHNMAYILGFILADGCIIKTKNKNQLILSFCIARFDKCILEFIRNEISPNRKIYNSQTIKNKTLCYDCHLEFPSKILCTKLMQLGIRPRKTGKEILPKIPTKYKYSFLQGLFDGDGCITKSKCGQYKFSICSSNEKFLFNLKKYYQNKGWVFYPKSGYGTWGMSSYKDIIWIFNKLYRNVKVILDRKFVKFPNGNY